LLSLLTSVELIGTWLILAGVERCLISSGGMSGSVLTATTASVALGLHGVGEGFTIAASFLAGRIASALLFTVGFTVHNITEGFAIAGPFFTRSPVKVL
jgi:ZIP family zinc transporter